MTGKWTKGPHSVRYGTQVDAGEHILAECSITVLGTPAIAPKEQRANARLFATADAMHTAGEALADAVEAIEWAGRSFRKGPACPVCHVIKGEKHQSICKLSIALAAWRATAKKARGE